MYKLLDVFFLTFHSALVIFNVFGWMWKKTRLANLITNLLTGASWFILGIFFGIGFCPLTEWHWQVLHKLGKYDLPDSYMKYILDRITGLNLNPKLVDTSTVVVFFLSVGFSVYFNMFHRKFLKKHNAI